MANKTSEHILNTSATLLGFCLFVITSMHALNHAETSKIDEFTSIIALLLIFSCLLSFISIQTSHAKREKRSEKIAEYLFASSLFGILIILSLLAFNIVK